MTELKKINELFDFEKGMLQSSKCVSGEYDFITASSEWKTHKEFAHDTEALIVAVAASGSLGRVHYVNGKFISSDLCFILMPKNRDNFPIDLSFYFYVFKLFRDDLVKKTATGTSKMAINQTNFGNYKIPYFDIKHQKKYRSKLIKLANGKNELKSKLNSQNNLLQKLCQAILQDAIDSSNKKAFLDDVCEFIKGESPIQKTNPGEYPLVVTGEARKTANKFQFNTKAVCIPLVSSIGHGNKSLNYVHYQEGKFALGNILVAVVPKNQNILNAKFLHQYLLTNKDSVLVALMKGMANVTLPIRDLKKVEIPLPCIGKQNKVEFLMQKLNKLEAEISQNQKTADILMQAVLKEAFYQSY